jgi:hypothetical protein
VDASRRKLRFNDATAAGFAACSGDQRDGATQAASIARSSVAHPKKIGDAFHMRRYLAGLLGAVAMTAAMMCGGSSSVPCTTGQSSACTGAAGCSGFQVCKSDGTYDACICASVDGAVTDALNGESGSDALADASIDTEADGASWTPADLSGLQLWYEGSHVDGDAGPITSWPDQSPNHNTLAPSGAPTFVSNGIGGQPAVLVSSNDGIIGPMPAIGTMPYIAEVVARTATASSTGTFWDMSSSVSDSTHCNFIFFINPAGFAAPRYNCNSPDSTTMAFDATAVHIFGIRRTSVAQAQLRVDGSATAFSLTSSESVGAPTTLGLGSMDILIAEVVLATNPSDNDVSQLETYLRTKYGL